MKKIIIGLLTILMVCSCVPIETPEQATLIVLAPQCYKHIVDQDGRQLYPASGYWGGLGERKLTFNIGRDCKLNVELYNPYGGQRYTEIAYCYTGHTTEICK